MESSKTGQCTIEGDVVAEKFKELTHLKINFSKNLYYVVVNPSKSYLFSPISTPFPLFSGVKFNTGRQFPLLTILKKIFNFEILWEPNYSPSDMDVKSDWDAFLMDLESDGG